MLPFVSDDASPSLSLSVGRGIVPFPLLFFVLVPLPPNMVTSTRAPLWGSAWFEPNGAGSASRLVELCAPAWIGRCVAPCLSLSVPASCRSSLLVESPSSSSRRECGAGVRPPSESGSSLRTGLSLLQRACAGALVGRRVPLAGGLRLCGASLCCVLLCVRSAR